MKILQIVLFDFQSRIIDVIFFMQVIELLKHILSSKVFFLYKCNELIDSTRLNISRFPNRIFCQKKRSINNFWMWLESYFPLTAFFSLATFMKKRIFLFQNWIITHPKFLSNDILKCMFPYTYFYFFKHWMYSYLLWILIFHIKMISICTSSFTTLKQI